MHYLSIDPGAANTGWASFSETGEVTGNGVIRGGADKFMDWLEELDEQPKNIIYETYRNRKHMMMSTNKTSQLIGMIKRHATKNKIKLIESEPQNLYIGLRYLGLFEAYGSRGAHVPDDVSALSHGVYVLTKLKIRKHRLDKNGT